MLLRASTAFVVFAAVAVAGPRPAGADEVNLRISLATFTGGVWIQPATRTERAKVMGRAGRDQCHVAGIRVSTSVPFRVSCEFEFETADAKVSAKCSGAWAHVSTLEFNDPFTGQPVFLNYDPTATSVSEGDGGGVGVQYPGIGKVKFAITSLCAISPEDGPVSGNLVGYATGP